MKSFDIEVRDFDLDHIFDCGQCFRWRKQADGSYTGTAHGRIVNMSFKEGASKFDGRLKITNLGEHADDDLEKIWIPYLDLERDYGEIKSTLSKNDEVIRDAISYGAGIRILKQELWETIVSFIISQNNNIPRIKGCIENLSREFGERIEADDTSWLNDDTERVAKLENYAIPSPEILASLTQDDLASIKLGYRSRYLIESAKTVCEKGLPNNFEQLSELCGVGPKVANCIRLFGMNETDSFPIDVWVKRVMARLYGFEENNIKGMESFAGEKFGKLSGFAQQYLFYYIRNLDAKEQ